MRKPISVTNARERLGRKAQIVKDAAQSPQGRALIDLIEQEFGMPPIGGDNQFRALANLGQLEVVQWLKQMENYERLQNE